jgi:NADPH-dependent 2,4-dienoyl-CoA reductase/sulfur reductase-like enzyme/rhodanese-related sulfurtransferase
MNEHAEIILLERDEHVSFANCGLPYHIGGEIAERGKLLVATRELLEKRFRLDVRVRHEAVRIDRSAKVVHIRDLQTGEEYSQSYDKLILSPGASPIVPAIEGAGAEGVYKLRNIADMDRIIAAVRSSTSRKAVVVGAGFIGLEIVEQLIRIGFEVSLAELQHQVLPPLDHEMAVPLEEELERHGVQLHLGDGLESVTVDTDGRATGIRLASGNTLESDVIILGLGVRPNTELAVEAGLQTGTTQGIATNEFMQTSDPDIYAVGDACEYVCGPAGQQMRVPLAGPANRSGRLAGQHAATGSSRPHDRVYGTSIVRVLEQSAGITGLSIKAARQLGINAHSVTMVAKHHAGYFPGATPLTLKLVFCPETGKVLGGQAVGKNGVDKRLDVIATAMAFGGTVRDLAGLDLTYAPPFGSAKDIIHLAAFSACNHMDGIGHFLDADADLTDLQVVDVRTTAEVERAPLAGCSNAINIPVDELRAMLGQLDPALPTVVSCGVGMRAHVAIRILKQSGFENVSNLSGGAMVRGRAMKKRGQS